MAIEPRVTVTIDKEAEALVSDVSDCVGRLVKHGLLTKREGGIIVERLKRKLAKYIKVKV